MLSIIVHSSLIIICLSAAEIVHTFDAFGFNVENEFVCVCRYAGMRIEWYYLENGIFSQFIVLIYVIALWRESTSSATMWSRNAYGASKLNENAFNENGTKRNEWGNNERKKNQHELWKRRDDGNKAKRWTGGNCKMLYFCEMYRLKVNTRHRSKRQMEYASNANAKCRCKPKRMQQMENEMEGERGSERERNGKKSLLLLLIYQLSMVFTSPNAILRIRFFNCILAFSEYIKR